MRTIVREGAKLSEALTKAVHAIMREAAERAILPRYQSLTAHQIDAKAADDVVTIADHEAEAILSEQLARLLPEATIVGEEAAHADPAVLDRLGDALCWIVDPLDGTNNFAKGKQPFGILVALAEAGETVAGWIYDPLSGRFCHARRGKGAWIGEDRITARVSGQNPPVAAISLVFAEPCPPSGSAHSYCAALHPGRYPALRRRAVSQAGSGRKRHFDL